MQTRALLSKLGLPTNHYITLARPLPATLLAAMAVCLMPPRQAYELLVSADGPEADSGRAGRAGASAEPGSIKSVGIGLSAGASTESSNASADRVPGTVEVRAAPLQPAQGQCLGHLEHIHTHLLDQGLLSVEQSAALAVTMAAARVIDGLWDAKCRGELWQPGAFSCAR